MQKQKPAASWRRVLNLNEANRSRGSLLPRALLVPIGLEPLAALVLRHLQPTFLFQIAHGIIK